MRALLPLALLVVMGLASPAAAADPIDLNNATQKELESLPGIGEKLAQDIIDNRPYASVDDLLQIPRFGKSRLTKIRDLVTVEPQQDSPATAAFRGRIPRKTSIALASAYSVQIWGLLFRAIFRGRARNTLDARH